MLNLKPPRHTPTLRIPAEDPRRVWSDSTAYLVAA